MALPAARAFAALLVVVAVASAQQPSAPRAPVADDPARAARLLDERRALEAGIAAADVFGRQEEFLAAARARHEKSREQRWIDVRDGWVQTLSLERYVGWSSPQSGRAAPAALDFELKHHPLQAIVDLDAQLRAHGIDFLLVSFPTRVELYPELILDLPAPPPPTGADPARSRAAFRGMQQCTRRFLLELVKRGVDVLDLGPAFAEQRFGADGDRSDQLFLRTNQHWTPRAAELAARLVAERVRASPWWKPGVAGEGEFVVKPFDFDYEGPNDKPEGAGKERLRGDQVRRADGKGLFVVSRESPIVLLGDSHAEYFKSEGVGFNVHLWSGTGLTLDIVNPLGGAVSAARDALRRREDDLAGKKLVVWLLSDQNFAVQPMWDPLPMFK